MSIQLEHVYYTYPNGYTALEDINLTISEGEKVAIVGQNGAGKTTAVKLMNRIHKPTKGRVLVDGVDTRERTTAQIAKFVGYVFQNPDDQIFNQSVVSEVQYMLKRTKVAEEEIKRRTDHALALTGLEAYRETNPYDIPLPLRKFLTIAAVIATQPRYIVLDEPTAGQDSRGNAILRQIIGEMTGQGVAVVTISHDMDFVADNFDRVVAMAHKNVVLDACARDVFWNDQALEECRIRRPGIAEIAHLLGWDDERVLHCDEMVELICSHSQADGNKQ
ncbi:MAG TPA: energy-coupling factor ABC transporter ATP-binding protein [Candidatus Fournierella excrementigallinarum]|uniref:energy-coupling factor ABC transporter ATP-binding protein n=1 Tax=Candidatus Allofournierella merdipullorum TaxID=2838595 RepID=UPI001F970125|nr:energy-coupling factor ABC transporter ATP-binding protein [Candidatus Fournierella excrementigallinarum]